MHTNGYHTHNHCKHDIAYCQICDICYCTKCNREWGTKQYHIDVQPWYWTYRGVPYTVTYNNGNYSLTTSNGTAVKDGNTMTAFYSSVNNSSNSTSHVHS